MAGRTDPFPQSRKLTYEDYVTLPDDGRRYEILDGELAVSPSPTSAHQLVSHNLEFGLSAYELIATYSGDEVARFDVPDSFVLALAEIWPED